MRPLRVMGKDAADCAGEYREATGLRDRRYQAGVTGHLSWARFADSLSIYG